MHDGTFVEKSKKEFTEARRSREKWVGGEFKTIFGSSKNKIPVQKNFITAPVQKVEWRKEERRKWLAGNFKVV